jgi:hypothetical protein
LKQIFSRIGFVLQGSGYLPDKVNDFIWMMPRENIEKMAKDSLPQVVLADFRINLLSLEAQKIIQKVVCNMTPFDFELFDEYLVELQKGNAGSINSIVDMVYDYINLPPQIFPTLAEYNYIKHENPLIAWTMLLGRKVNHFGVSLHLKDDVQNLQSYIHNLNLKYQVELNNLGGVIKGSRSLGIEQSSTVGEKLMVTLDGQNVEVRDCFLEFVWRFSAKENPMLWSDYFTGFIPYNANSVIESLYDTAI